LLSIATAAIKRCTDLKVIVSSLHEHVAADVNGRLLVSHQTYAEFGLLILDGCLHTALDQSGRWPYGCCGLGDHLQEEWPILGRNTKFGIVIAP
jgi:hypothetical protein